MAWKYPTDIDIKKLPLPNRQLMEALANVISQRGMNRSDVARASGLTRDNISRWARGTSFPTLDMLEKLARGLRVEPSDLVPCIFNGEYTEEPLLSRKPRGQSLQNAPALSIQTSEDDPLKAWLRINQLVSIETALAVVKLIRDAEAAENDTTNRAASGG